MPKHFILSSRKRRTERLTENEFLIENLRVDSWRLAEILNKFGVAAFETSGRCILFEAFKLDDSGILRYLPWLKLADSLEIETGKRPPRNLAILNEPRHEVIRNRNSPYLKQLSMLLSKLLVYRGTSSNQLRRFAK